MPATGFPMTLLPGRGIQRRLTPANLAAVGGLLVAFVRALRPRSAGCARRSWWPSAATPAWPSALAAVLRRIPVVVAEQNIVPGAANRLLARFAQASAVASRARRSRGRS